MKRICMLLLALVLALSGVGAMAAEGDALLGRNDEEGNLYFNYCFAVGDTLYMVGYSSLFSYRVGDADMVEYTYDLPETEDGTYDVSVMPFADGDRLYAFNLYTHYGETSEFEGAKLVSMAIGEDNSIRFEALFDVDWSDMVEYYDNNSYPSRPECVVGMGGKALMRCYDMMGNGYALYSVDLASGKREQVSEIRDLYSLTPYRDGQLLVEEYNYESPTAVRLEAYDPASGSLQPLAQLEVEDYSPLQGLAYDAATDTVYCVRGGEICPVDLQAGQVGAGVTDMPLEPMGTSSASCVLPGGYFAFCTEGVAIRNLDPAQKAQIRLKISDSSWSEAVNNAYYRFANAHGDVSVVLSREYSDAANLIENMMNRDDSIDVYVLSASTPTYDALYNRGYLMELDGSEKLNALAEGMYPTIREQLSQNGRLVALPLSTYAYTLGINEKALTALGLSVADVPGNWSDFLDFLVGLKDVMGSQDRVKLFYSGYSDVDARFELFNSLFDDYQTYINLKDPAMGYNTPLLRELIEKLDSIDFTALGCFPEEDRDEYSDSDYEYSDDSMLLQTGTGCTIGNFYSDFTPLLLQVEPGVASPICMETTVAFVNPFTKNPETALAFMEELADNLPDSTRYCVDPSLTEPVRGKWNEEAMADWQKTLDELKQELSTAEAADVQMIEDSIRDVEENLAYYDEYGWDVGPKDLEWFRAHDEGITIAKVNWLYSDEGGEAWDLISQYREGQISAADMLAGIDRKLQMMLMEGN